MFGLDGLFSGLGNLIGSTVNSAFNLQAQQVANETNLRIARETNNANRALSERAYQQNLEQWERENAYNTPKAQMERFKAAGLNPNLIYGQSNTSGSSPQMSYTPMKAPQVAPGRIGLDFSGLGEIMTLATLGDRIKMFKNEVSKSDYNTSMMLEELKQKKMQNTFLETNYKQQITETNERIQNLAEQRKNLIQDYENKKVSHSTLLKQLSYLDAQIDNAKSQNRLYGSQIAKYQVDTDLAKKQSDVFDKMNALDIALKEQDIDIKRSLSGQKDTIAEKAKAEKNLWRILNNLVDYLKSQYGFSFDYGAGGKW